MNTSAQDNKGFVMFDKRLYSSTNIEPMPKLLLAYYIDLVRYEKSLTIQYSDIEMGKFLGYSDDRIRNARIKLEKLGYISSRRKITKGKFEGIIIHLNQDKIAEDFGSHIFNNLPTKKQDVNLKNQNKNCILPPRINRESPEAFAERVKAKTIADENKNKN